MLLLSLDINSSIMIPAVEFSSTLQSFLVSNDADLILSRPIMSSSIPLERMMSTLVSVLPASTGGPLPMVLISLIGEYWQTPPIIIFSQKIGVVALYIDDVGIFTEMITPMASFELTKKSSLSRISRTWESEYHYHANSFLFVPPSLSAASVHVPDDVKKYVSCYCYLICNPMATSESYQLEIPSSFIDPSYRVRHAMSAISGDTRAIAAIEGLSSSGGTVDVLSRVELPNMNTTRTLVQILMKNNRLYVIGGGDTKPRSSLLEYLPIPVISSSLSEWVGCSEVQSMAGSSCIAVTTCIDINHHYIYIFNTRIETVPEEPAAKRFQKKALSYRFNINTNEYTPISSFPRFRSMAQGQTPYYSYLLREASDDITCALMIDG
jgi:hypothetical protein